VVLRTLSDRLDGWLVGWSIGSLTGARMALRSTGVLALVNSLGAILGTR